MAAWWCQSCMASRRTAGRLAADWPDWSNVAGTQAGACEYSNPTFTISNHGHAGPCHTSRIPTPGISAIPGDRRQWSAGTPFTITATHRVLERRRRGAFISPRKANHRGARKPGWARVVRPPRLRPPRSRPFRGNWDFPVVLSAAAPAARLRARPGRPPVRVMMVNNEPFPAANACGAAASRPRLARRRGRHPQPCARCRHGRRRHQHAQAQLGAGGKAPPLGADQPRRNGAEGRPRA